MKVAWLGMIQKSALCGQDYRVIIVARHQLPDIVSVDGVPLNLSEKDQKWLGIKDTFKFWFSIGATLLSEHYLLNCIDCGKNFFTPGEKAFYESHNLILPKRCKACREKRKNIRVESTFKRIDISALCTFIFNAFYNREWFWSCTWCEIILYQFPRFAWRAYSVGVGDLYQRS